jgi:NAD(P)-dependent dehydrogenase (short-subunit alcohol dehydrogenase family)
MTVSTELEMVMTPSNPPDRRELVVVSGASTGMGAATAKELARNGFHVLAGVRRVVDADALRAEGIEPHILDITVDSDVAAIADRVARDPLGRPLRALVNNAGISVNAPVETLPIAKWRRLFEVNLFGHVAMTQALLPTLLRSAGTVVNISSVGGRVALPTYGAYAGSKFALEAVSDSLRREVSGLGVKVVVVEPGAVKTEMLERGVANADRLKVRHGHRSTRALWRSRRGDLGAGPIIRQGRCFRRKRRQSCCEGGSRASSAHSVHDRT